MVLALHYDVWMIIWRLPYPFSSPQDLFSAAFEVGLLRIIFDQLCCRIHAGGTLNGWDSKNPGMVVKLTLILTIFEVGAFIHYAPVNP